MFTASLTTFKLILLCALLTKVTGVGRFFLRISSHDIQPVSYKWFFRCNYCLLLLVYTIHLSLSTDLIDPPSMGTIYIKHALPDSACFTRSFSSSSLRYSSHLSASHSSRTMYASMQEYNMRSVYT